MMKKRKFLNKNGIALILTISVLTAVSVLGITFLGLLARDQKVGRLKTLNWFGEDALKAAVRAGINEIHYMTGQYKCDASGPDTLSNSNYVGSIIESSDSKSLLYFKNTIKATNAKLSLYQQSGCEFNNVLKQLGTILNIYSATKNITDALMLYKDNWKVNDISELVKIKYVGPVTVGKLKDHVTIFPQDTEGFVVNVIDYGRCIEDLVADNRIKAFDRSFKPHGAIEFDYLKGARVKIISGPGKGQVNIVDLIDSTDWSRLILEKDWADTLPASAGVNPTDQSFYRLYSYVVPININAASPELIRANFEMLASYTDLTAANVDSLLGRIDIYRAAAIPLLIGDWSEDEDLAEGFKGFKKFLDDSGITAPADKNQICDFFNPEKPKVIHSGTYNVYPPVVPFCFSHNGYFDMEIEAGNRLNRSATRPRNLKKYSVTVKVMGTKTQTLREDFEEGVKQHWVSTSDWVPVMNMADTNWGNVVNDGNALPLPDPSRSFRPHNDVVNPWSPNVIPDAIKNGLWFDFSASSEGRDTDKIFNEDAATNALVLMSDANLQAFFKADSVYNAATSVAISSITNRLHLKGAGATPHPQILVRLGQDSGTYVFGEIAVMTDIKDEDGTNVFTIDHSLAPSDYSGGGLISDHEFANHKPEKLFPPKPYFTPAFFMWNNGTDAVDVRSEYNFESNYYSTTTPAYLCTLPVANYAYDRDFSVSFTDADYTDKYFRPYSGPLSFIDSYRLMFAAAIMGTTDSHFSLFVDVDGVILEFRETNLLKAGAGNHLGENSNPLGSITNNGKIGFKRIYNANFYDDDVKTGEFSVGYLRVIPGDNESATLEIEKHPNFTSVQMEAPGVKEYVHGRVYYKVGKRKDGSFDASDNFSFNFGLDLISGGITDSATAVSGDISITIADDPDFEGYFDFELPSQSDFGNPTNPEDFSYQVFIINRGVGADERLAFLKHTIAITKVEIFYETDVSIVSLKER